LGGRLAELGHGLALAQGLEERDPIQGPDRGRQGVLGVRLLLGGDQAERGAGEWVAQVVGDEPPRFRRELGVPDDDEAPVGEHGRGLAGGDEVRRLVLVPGVFAEVEVVGLEQRLEPVHRGRLGRAVLAEQVVGRAEAPFPGG
jgi:hypothetical protein